MIVDLQPGEECYSSVMALKVDKERKLWLLVNIETFEKRQKWMIDHYLHIKRIKNGEYFVTLHGQFKLRVSDYSFNKHSFVPVANFELAD